ncbi:DnaA regulatory inactivator Hda [Sediminihaliea albiluteola]|uniref:DnaA regulatory inactivator Hda n=1 Tax=Sediminihaliea albiluteola TaxID=2758564 RepID=UPI002E2DD595|nr:DnaA regulatory inactivator Hda [Sediminihaliea albiluteola]
MATLKQDSGLQLALNVQLRDEATLSNFLVLSEALQVLMPLLERQLEPDGEQVIFLHGPADSGKSHLLQASCHRAGSAALYLPLAELRTYAAEAVLADMEHMALVCLDDVQAVLGDESWEQALFHFFNRARATGCRLLLSADAAPRALAVQLADLGSRLSWGLVYHLPSYNDEQKIALLRFRAERRGLQLPLEAARYLVNRAPRALSELWQLLEQLDRQSLAEQRALTVPFIKRTMGW